MLGEMVGRLRDHRHIDKVIEELEEADGAAHQNLTMRAAAAARTSA
jgi:hypothetical protein